MLARGEMQVQMQDRRMREQAVEYLKNMKIKTTESGDFDRKDTLMQINAFASFCEKLMMEAKSDQGTDLEITKERLAKMEAARENLVAQLQKAEKENQNLRKARASNPGGAGDSGQSAGADAEKNIEVLKKLAAVIKNRDEEIQALKDEVQELKAENAQLEEKNRTFSQQIGMSRKAIDIKLEKVRAEIQGLRASKVDLEEKCRRAAQQLAEKEETIEALSAEIGQLKGEGTEDREEPSNVIKGIAWDSQSSQGVSEPSGVNKDNAVPEMDSVMNRLDDFLKEEFDID